jgi:hypothetical protein
MPRVPQDILPPPPPVTPPTPGETSLQRREALNKATLSREELQEYLQDTLDPLSADERQWVAAWIEHAGDWQAIADASGITARRARSIMARPRLRRALGMALGSMASPESIVAGLADQAFGDDKVSEYWPADKITGRCDPKRVDHKLRQDALLALAKLRGLLVDRLDVRGTLQTTEELDRMLASELARVRGALPGSQSIEPVDVAPIESKPQVDQAGEPPVDSDLVDP